MNHLEIADNNVPGTVVAPHGYTVPVVVVVVVVRK